jgi:integrase
VPSLRKRILKSGTVVWDIRYSVGGKQKSYHIGETDRRTAEKIFHKFCNSIVEGKADGTQSSPAESTGPTLSQLASETAIYAGSNKSPKTQEREALVFQAVIRELGDIPLVELTPAKIEGYKAARLTVASPSTVNIEIRVLNTALNQAAELGWYRLDGRKAFKQLRLPESEPLVWLTKEQITDVLSTPDPEFRRFLQFLLQTGCRRNEALGMTWQDIDLARKQLVVRGEIGKMGKRRTVPVSTVLLRVLDEWPGPRIGRLFPHYEPNQISMKFRRWARQIGLPPGLSLHSLRATFGSQLVAAGVNIYVVSRLLGHSSVRVTEKHYLTLAPEHVHDAVNRLDFE